jgi:protein-disulfide isomerase
MSPVIPTYAGAKSRLALSAAALVATLLGAVWGPGTQAQQGTGEQSTAITGEQANIIIQELKEIRKLLESIDKKGVAQAPKRPPVPQTAKVSIKDSESLGAADAPVTVVEFTDYQCPYCLRFIQQTFPKLREEFIDTGKVRWVIRDLPLGFHKHARKAAQAAHCAGEQDKFWEMRDVLFTNAKKLQEENLPKYAQVIGLDAAAFAACLASDRHLASIDNSIRDARTVQITGTPTFVVGKAASHWVEGARIVGARDHKIFEAQISKVLASKQAVAQ